MKNMLINNPNVLIMFWLNRGTPNYDFDLQLSSVNSFSRVSATVPEI